MKRLLIYALGGGLGHVTRSLALARALEKQGETRCALLTNSPLLDSPVIPKAPFGISLRSLPPNLERAAIRKTVPELIDEARPDGLIVDALPRGLAGELESTLKRLSCPRVLVHRDLSPRYLEHRDVRKVIEYYDLLLCPGERGRLSGHPRARTTRPWLLLDPCEIASREAARVALELPRDGRPVIAVSACGRRDERPSIAALFLSIRREFGDRAHIRLLSVQPFDSLPAGRNLLIWPLIRFLPGMDLLIGAGGYNTVWEARATGTALRALARRRLYDRQARRLQGEEMSACKSDLLRAIAAFLDSYETPAPSQPYYINGCKEASRLIAALWGQEK